MKGEWGVILGLKLLALDELPDDVGDALAEFASHGHEAVERQCDFSLFAVAAAIDEAHLDFTFRSLGDRLLLADRIRAWNTIDGVRVELRCVQCSNVDLLVVLV